MANLKSGSPIGLLLALTHTIYVKAKAPRFGKLPSARPMLSNRRPPAAALANNRGRARIKNFN